MRSIYIHIPFCERKCFYCSFAVNVYQLKDAGRYIDCVLKEAERFRGTEVNTIYVGGGTPSLLDEGQTVRLLCGIRELLVCSQAVETTFEMNPEDVDARKARLLKNLGVNRISLGVQTFNDGQLKALGRAHDAKQATVAFQILREAGFSNISMDLIGALPGQSCGAAIFDVGKTVGFAPEHVSFYLLSVEKNSLFFGRRMAPVCDEEQAQIYMSVREAFKESGYHQYEISNYAFPGSESVHNINYWQGGDYIGLGVAAHSHQAGHRCWNVFSLNDYMRLVEGGQSLLAGEETLKPEEFFLERLLLGLRMTRGVSVQSLEQECGCRLPQKKADDISAFVAQGLLAWDNGRLVATGRGQLVLDEISARLI